MKRRNFLTGLGPLAIAPLAAYSEIKKTNANDQQYIEVLKYTLPFGDNKGRTEKYYEEAAIPALNKLGIENVGVFNGLIPCESVSDVRIDFSFLDSPSTKHLISWVRPTIVL